MDPPPPTRLASTFDMPTDNVTIATIMAAKNFFMLPPEM
jgi:hypothetical protein